MATKLPDHFYAPNRFSSDEPATLYIIDPAFLIKEKIDVDKKSFDFFKDIDKKLEDASKNANNEVFSNWILSLKKQHKLLAINDNSFIREGYLKYTILFAEVADVNNSKNFMAWPSGIALQLLDDKCLEDSNLPSSLLEVYRFGRLFLAGGIAMSGHFYHPSEINKAVDEYWLSDYLAENNVAQGLGDKLNELRVFYTESGCWMMFDLEENVYVGGIECSGFYKSRKKLDDVVRAIFTTLLEGSSMVSISKIAPF